MLLGQAGSAQRKLQELLGMLNWASGRVCARAIKNLRCFEMSVVGCRGEGSGRLCYFEVAKRESGGSCDRRFTLGHATSRRNVIESDGYIVSWGLLDVLIVIIQIQTARCVCCCLSVWRRQADDVFTSRLYHPHHATLPRPLCTVRHVGRKGSIFRDSCS
jgi:hypothetical protein